MKDAKNNPAFNKIVLKDLRLQKKLSAYALARLSGIGEDVIHKLEKGKYARPTFDTVAALAFALEVSTDVFVNPMSL